MKLRNGLRKLEVNIVPAEPLRKLTGFHTHDWLQINPKI